eukprot:12920846-Prorocentrum_lima.AAC.1
MVSLQQEVAAIQGQIDVVSDEIDFASDAGWDLDGGKGAGSLVEDLGVNTRPSEVRAADTS